MTLLVRIATVWTRLQLVVLALVTAHVAAAEELVTCSARYFIVWFLLHHLQSSSSFDFY